VGALTASVLQNQCRVHPVTTMVKGMFGIEEEVFLSVPCVLNRVGVSSVIPLDLSEKELQKLLASVKALAATQASLAEHFQAKL
jgi:L-lactate dehydrogenase